MTKPGDVAAFLREKIAATGMLVAARTSAAEAWEYEPTPEDLRHTVRVTRAPRGAKAWTREECRAQAATERRIADKLRQEVRLYEAALAIVEAADA